jgi:cyclopropane fatty-acyl-phospholipid synthase-like methyltransferase
VSDKEEISSAERFALNYARPQSEAELRVEREVFGACIGSDGYTTVEEANVLLDRLALSSGGRLLDLGSGRRLLDLGSGRGWPGVYLAEESGCDVVLTDVPVSAPREALLAARNTSLAGHFAAAAAAGEALPIKSQEFDAVVHSDVFC